MERLKMKRARESNESYKLAIVGSRDFTNATLFNPTIEQYVIDHGMPSIIISGGAKGADTLAERWAKSHGIEPKVYKPKWAKYKKAAGILRNSKIVDACTQMIAFPSRHGRGTQDSIAKAVAKGIPVKIVEID